jgi:hypothetical protein
MDDCQLTFKNFTMLQVGPEVNNANMANYQAISFFINATEFILTTSLCPISQRNKKDKNIQQRGFAGGHPPNY